MIDDIQKLILTNLIDNEVYTRIAIPFIDRDFFEDVPHGIAFDLIKDFFEKYNSIPSMDTLQIELGNKENLSDQKGQEVYEVLQEIAACKAINDVADPQWLLDTTEKWCQDKSVFNAVMESLQILDGKDKARTKESIPTILQDALGVCFDSSVGHSYLNDAEKRYDFYHESTSVVESDIDIINRITHNGFPRKTLNIAMAGTGVGKSLLMCSLAAGMLTKGYNVLYITLEMSDFRIAERIDANLLNVPLDEIKDIPRDKFINRISAINDKSKGELVIREYPTGSAHAGHFRHLLNELKTKKKVKPDIVFVDYLNICASSRMKFGGSVNSYSYIKSIAEELRGLGVEYDVPIVSATQTNREGFANSDVDLTNTSESFGLPATADMMFAVITTEELDKMGQFMIKQLKNRYTDVGKLSKFVVGVDKPKMRVYDVEDPTDGLSKDPSASNPAPWDDTSNDSPLNSFGASESGPKFGSFKF